MNNTQQRIFFVSRWKYEVLLYGLLIALCVLTSHNPWIMWICVVPFLFILWKLHFPTNSYVLQKAFVLDDQGVYIYFFTWGGIFKPNHKHCLFLRWNEIKEIDLRHSYNFPLADFLVFKVKEPQVIIHRQSDPTMRLFLEKRLHQHACEFEFIRYEMLNVSFKKLLTLMRTYQAQCASKIKTSTGKISAR